MVIDHHILALEILNLTADATFEEAREAFHKSRKELHPDQYMDKPHLRASAEKTLAIVNAAWDFLKRNPWLGKCSTAAHTANRSPKPAPGDPAPDPDPLPTGFYRRGDGLFALLGGPYMLLPPEEVLVCSGHFDVVADLINSSDDNFYLVEFRGTRNKQMRLQILVDEPQKTITRKLKRKGLKLGSDKRAAALLLDFINRRQPKRHLTAVTTRWHGKCYVMRAGTIGPPSAEEFVLDASFRDCLETVTSTAESWRKTLGKYCVGNQLMTFAASIAFASVVLRPLGILTSMGFHFWGMSRIGKSTAAGMARSVTASALLNCKATAVGTEEDAIHHNDTLLAYDEQAQVDPKVFWMTAYTIGNGRSAGKHGSQRVTWILTWITSGEDSYPNFLKANKLPPIKEGQRVRLISIPAEIGPLGSFNTIHGFQDAETFAKQLAVLIEQNKGAVIVEFLKYFTVNYDAAIEKLKEKLIKFKQIQKLKYPDLQYAPAWVSGVLDHFATVAAAGELATEANCTGWPTGWAMQAASEEFALWYATEYKESTHIQQGAIQLLAWINSNKDRVESEIEKGCVIAWITVYDFKRACVPFDHQDVARELRRQGKLRSEKHDHLTRRKRIPGTDERPHYFCVVTTGDGRDAGDGMGSGSGSDTAWTSQPPLARQEPNGFEDVAGDGGDKETIR